MLILDQLKRGDRQLYVVAAGILLGIAILAAGLWQVQIVSGNRYRADLRDQSFRMVRVPAIRGKILDRNGIALAENRPCYTLNLYLEELRRKFTFEYTNRVKKEFLLAFPNQKLTSAIRAQLEREARFRVVSNYLAEVSAGLKVSPSLVEADFNRYYLDKRTYPFPLLVDLSSEDVALFFETGSHIPSVELEIQALRHYPFGATAAHVIGHLRRESKPADERDADYETPLPDFIGVKGLESAFDEELRGRPGIKSVLVNHLQYRESEETVLKAEPGKNVVLTLDLAIQRAAEKALRQAGLGVRGAAVVLDARLGDILALASAPSFNPNVFLRRISPDLWKTMNNEEQRPMFHRAVYGEYPPGSVFKIIVGLAALEAGTMDPHEAYYSPGFFQIGRSRPIGDTAGQGYFDFFRAFYRSSNPYFIAHGTNIGLSSLAQMGRKFGLGEPTGLSTRQEARGYFPLPDQKLKRDNTRWMLGDTANLCIGQGEILATPLQIAVMTAAVANGGKVLQPRLVLRLEPQDASSGDDVTRFPGEQITKHLSLSARNLEIMRKAMLDDVERPDGTGRDAAIEGFKIAGKTGTAQLFHAQRGKELITWFVSFAPFDNPAYAVVVVIEGGDSGGTTCAPMAKEIYEALLKREQNGSPLDTREETLAHAY